ncbi:MAG: AlpA family phage regulatory protein [Acetobacteraceae bacterium]|nr:MAG: AlpA family phage regulatory protein [Acetobacteraceae bacterium]
MTDQPKLPDPVLDDVQGVAALLGASAATVYRILRTDPSFPRPRQLGRRLTRWARGAVEAWITSRPAAQTAGRERVR